MERCDEAAVGWFETFGYFRGKHKKNCVVSADVVANALGQSIFFIGQCAYSCRFVGSSGKGLLLKGDAGFFIYDGVCISFVAGDMGGGGNILSLLTS